VQQGSRHVLILRDLAATTRPLKERGRLQAVAMRCQVRVLEAG